MSAPSGDRCAFVASVRRGTTEAGDDGVPVRPRVWIDDPHPIFRRGLATTVSTTCRVVGESAELRPGPTTHDADLLIFDLTTAGLRRASQLDGMVRLAVVQERGHHLMARALALGIAGLVARDGVSVDVLHHSIAAVLSGQTVVPSAYTAAILQAAADDAPDPDSAGLAEREVEVLRRLAAGGDTRSIASDLAFSERTVKNVVHDLLIKMNCRNRAHAVATATRHGLI